MKLNFKDKLVVIFVFFI